MYFKPTNNDKFLEYIESQGGGEQFVQGFKDLCLSNRVIGVIPPGDVGHPDDYDENKSHAFIAQYPNVFQHLIVKKRDRASICNYIFIPRLKASQYHETLTAINAALNVGPDNWVINYIIPRVIYFFIYSPSNFETFQVLYRLREALINEKSLDPEYFAQPEAQPTTSRARVQFAEDPSLLCTFDDRASRSEPTVTEGITTPSPFKPRVT